MSDHRGVWGAREDAVWWPGAIAADQQQSFHHQQILHQQQAVQQQQQQQQPQSQQQQQHQQQQQNEIANSVAATQQLFSYKMASTFQHPATTMSNVSTPSSIGTSGMRGGYDYRLGGGMTGGNPAMTGPSPAPPQWWYPGVMDNSMQNSIANTHQSNMQNMSPVQTPPPVTQQSQINASVQHQQAEAQVRQQQHQAAEAHRHQEVQRHQAEAQAARQQAEAQAVRQAVAEAQARHQQTQQNHLQQQNHHGQQNHHQSQQQNQVLTQAQHTQTLHQSIQQNNQSIHHLLVDHQQSTDQKSHQQITVQVPTRGRMPRGSKADARPRGRMTAYAFFVQTCREEHKKKHPEENVVFAEFSKKCSERWKTMVDKEKKRFHEMAEKDKKRYDTEMQNYTPPKGEKQRGKKRKQNKDPNAPKRSLSAFFWFCNDERGKVKGQNPEYGVGDIAKELGRRWADADSEMKSRYEAMAEKDKARYEKEMTAYKKKNNPSLPAAPVPEPQEEEDEEDEEGDEDEDD